MASKKNDVQGDLLLNVPKSVGKTLKTKASSKNTLSTSGVPQSPANPVNLNKPQPSTEPFATASHSSKKGPTTRIIVKYDVGFNNAIYLRGEGAGLSWDRGIMLKNIKSDEWIWETNIPFTACDFKVLINDRQYELGENHKLKYGTSFEYTPSFHKI